MSGNSSAGRAPRTRSLVRSVLALIMAAGLALGGVVLGSPAANAAPGDSIDMPDDVVRTYFNARIAALTGTTRTPDQAITEGEAAAVPVFGIGFNLAIDPTLTGPITSLEGLQWFTNLTAFGAFDQPLSDLGPLSSLGLEDLMLKNTGVTVIPPLAIEWLYLVDNPGLASIDLNHLPNLKVLEILDSPAIDVSGSSTTLDKVVMGGVDPYLDLISRMPVGDLSGFFNAPNVSSLLLVNTDFSDTAVLANMAPLATGTLAYNAILDLSPLPDTFSLVNDGAPHRDRANGQVATVASVAAGAAFPNPVKDIDGTAVPVASTDPGFSFDPVANTWSFSTPGLKTLTFANDPSDPSFSGTITQEVTAAVTVPSVTPGIPTISGTARVGEVLTANPGTWAPVGTTFTYKWQVNGVDVIGATGVTFTPTTAHVGADVTVEVTGSATGYTPASATSAPVTVHPAAVTPPVTPTAPPTTAPPTTPPTDDVTQQPILRVSVPRAEVGNLVTFVGDRFGPDEDVELVLHSDPIVLLTVRTSASGSFTQSIIVPSAPTGPHKVVGTGKTTGLSASVDFEIVAPASAGYRSDELAQTGAEPSLILFVIAGVLLVAGAGLGGAQLLTRRRIG